MKRHLAIGLVLVLLAGAAMTAEAQEAKDILARMIEAQGGRATLAAIQDSTTSGALEMVAMGMSGSATIYQKEPSKMRVDIEIAGMMITQAFDGEKAWMTNPQTGTTEEMPEALAQETKRQALGVDATLHPEKYGITFVLKGKQKDGDKEYWVLEQTFSDGKTATLWVDPETYLLAKTRTKTQDVMGGGEVEADTVFGDYRKSGDITAAYKMTTYQSGAEVMRMVFSKIEYNTKLDDAFFKMPR